VTRHAVRVVLLDEADRVLLVRFWDGDHSWWCTPGGGIERGESELAAAARELREELGDAPIEIGPCLWTRRHVGIYRGQPFDQSERIYLGRVPAFTPQPSPAALREHSPGDIRWWTADELASSPEEFAPRRLAQLLHELLADGPPVEPIDVGV
jgi:8-oxo-dGTP pyrophosphatase MutT (NUDIX family)